MMQMKTKQNLINELKQNKKKKQNQKKNNLKMMI
jgi:hypothetical protein